MRGRHCWSQITCEYAVLMFLCLTVKRYSTLDPKWFIFHSTNIYKMTLNIELQAYVKNLQRLCDLVYLSPRVQLTQMLKEELQQELGQDDGSSCDGGMRMMWKVTQIWRWSRLGNGRTVGGRGDY